MRSFVQALFLPLVALSFFSSPLLAEESQPQSENGRQEVPWTTDYAEATQQAKEMNKPILLFFTGSDWCGYCKRLDASVLDTETFAKEVNDHFIFVKIDFPMYTKVSNAVAAQNEALRVKHKVRGFPTLILLTPELREMGVTGYKDLPAKEYAKHLKEIEEGYYRSIQAMTEDPPYEPHSLNLATTSQSTDWRG